MGEQNIQEEIILVGPLRVLSYPAPHCGAPGEQGGSRPRDECAAGASDQPKRIVKILGVKDTREYSENDQGQWKPIPGSGEAHVCDRCGKFHEVHAFVELEDETVITVGTGCMKAETDEATQKQISRMESAAKKLKSLETQLEAKNEEYRKWYEKWNEIEALPLPSITFSERIGDTGRPIKVAHMGDTEVWFSAAGETFTEYRKEALIDRWRNKRMREAGFGTIRPYGRDTLENKIKKIKKKMEALQVIEERSYPAPHCGRPGEQGGSAPRDECAAGTGEEGKWEVVRPDKGPQEVYVPTPSEVKEHPGSFRHFRFDPERIDEVIAKIQKILQGQEWEYLYILDSRGIGLAKTSGMTSSIVMTDQEVLETKRMYHSVLIHNHPSWNVEVKDEISPPSLTDILAACNFGALESRVVTEGKTYVMKIHHPSALEGQKRKWLLDTWNDITDKHLEEYVPRLFERDSEGNIKTISKEEQITLTQFDPEFIRDNMDFQYFRFRRLADILDKIFTVEELEPEK